MATMSLTVVFDGNVWPSLTPKEKQEWVDDVISQVNTVAHCTDVSNVED